MQGLKPFKIGQQMFYVERKTSNWFVGPQRQTHCVFVRNTECKQKLCLFPKGTSKLWNPASNGWQNNQICSTDQKNFKSLSNNQAKNMTEV